MRRLFFVAIAAAAFASPASASQLIDRNASLVRLTVDWKSQAYVTYRAHGRNWRVRAWGAINALHPTPDRPQVQFRIRRDATPVQNACRPYDGPKLAWLAGACKAPDGSYWAVQRFPRKLPNLGFLPWLPEQRAWALLRKPGEGAFCYTFRARDPRTGGNSAPPTWPRGRLRGPGTGDRYRITVEGPGVTPDIVWETPGLEDFDQSNPEHIAHERRANSALDRLNDKLCKRH